MLASIFDYVEEEKEGKRKRMSIKLQAVYSRENRWLATPFCPLYRWLLVTLVPKGIVLLFFPWQPEVVESLVLIRSTQFANL
jgi:hypothetical protein